MDRGTGRKGSENRRIGEWNAEMAENADERGSLPVKTGDPSPNRNSQRRATSGPRNSAASALVRVPVSSPLFSNIFGRANRAFALPVAAEVH